MVDKTARFSSQPWYEVSSTSFRIVPLHVWSDMLYDWPWIRLLSFWERMQFLCDYVYLWV